MNKALKPINIQNLNNLNTFQFEIFELIRESLDFPLFYVRVS